MNVALIVLAVLGTWRLGSLLARERGPGAVFTRFRALFGVVHDSSGKPDWGEDGDELRLDSVSPRAWVDQLAWEIAGAITCIWCNSLWIALPLVLFVIAPHDPVIWNYPETGVLAVLAISAGAILFDQWVE